MLRFDVHSCTDVTGFSLMGHSFEMAQGSGCTVHIRTADVPYHPEAWELADMGFLPAGAYRNREYAEGGVTVRGGISRTMQDLLYDPQTSGGLLMAWRRTPAPACGSCETPSPPLPPWATSRRSRITGSYWNKEKRRTLASVSFLMCAGTPWGADRTAP